MLEEILPGLYRIEVPLPNSPLKALNSYVIKTSEQNIIIDTGMNHEECLNAMLEGLRKLAVDLQKTDFFITHLHSDHIGLVSRLAVTTSKVYFNQPDADILNSPGRWKRMFNFALKNGFPENELREVLKKHPGYLSRATHQRDFYILKEGDKITIGDYAFRCVETPGHTSGHLCLHEPKKKILISGDHLLGDITPNISLWSEQENPLSLYIDSLKKISEFTVELVLPGHRKIFRNCRERIEQLLRHHQNRADEILSILEKGNLNAYQVASRMTWEMTYASWDGFSATQKWFATGEAIAHLKYLEEKGRVLKEVRDQNVIFSVLS